MKDEDINPYGNHPQNRWRWYLNNIMGISLVDEIFRDKLKGFKEDTEIQRKKKKKTYVREIFNGDIGVCNSIPET